MHGVIRIRSQVDGEIIVKADIDIGYLHRAFEKSCEQGNYWQCIPYTDRLNYVSPLINNFGFAAAVEKLLGIQITERCMYIRVIMSEISRICDHLTCVAASAMELGAMTVFLYMMKAREYLYELVEEITGARLTVSYVRIGGVKADLTDDFIAHCRAMLPKVRDVLDEVDKLLKRNRIFYDRVKGVGILTKETATAYAYTGPMLRSAGIDYDVRKNFPYFVYDRLDFDVPVGTTGDNYDRYLVRMEEMRQSLRIVEQAMQQMPKGPINVDYQGKVMEAHDMVDKAKMGLTRGLRDSRVTLEKTLEGSEKEHLVQIAVDNKRVAMPAKQDVYGNIEGLMNHFMLIMDGAGMRPPVGEAYMAVEAGNGELGFYVASDGSDHPYRVRVRAPCFSLMAGLHHLLEGYTVADTIATFGSVNMIAGELDR
jgi:NADH-quinone oxidoreductase subunit D